MGDFNRHHPLWDEERNNHLFTTRNLNLTQQLLTLLGRNNMKMALPPQLPTLKAHGTGNLTRVDNVFCSEDTLDLVDYCNVEYADRPLKTDHYPIVTKIDINAASTQQPPRHNFRLAKWKPLVKRVKEEVEKLPPPTEIYSLDTFKGRLQALNTILQEAIQEHVPMTKPSPYMKRWWSTELKAMKSATRKLANRAHNHRTVPDHLIHEEYRQKRNSYSEMIRTAKAEHWAEWLEGLDESSVWTASRLVTSPASDAGRSRIPTLQVKDPVTKAIVEEASDNATILGPSTLRVPTPKVDLGNHRIESKTSAKFLGVLVDNTLRWKEQCAAALAKGHDWMIQFGRLARVTQGVSAPHVRQLYIAIAIPRILYAADIYLSPPRRQTETASVKKSGRAIINKLASVQRRAAIMATGAMRSTPTTALDALAGLIPFHLLVDKHRGPHYDWQHYPSPTPYTRRYEMQPDDM
ncbi:hypothetical protein D9615_004913 [Tricholomella constricta]|uniref:Endonuclease/exonuclease/phosphatase domain-containing protein n=1 Tax=Tricholomella constricta TaxID=117010 RepID=A0A8H5M6M9_9AGAR|nr:hypothetical protein D9615_004913 [Tricholomella constricta]